MSSKLGTILSMIFVVAFFLLSGDMMCLSSMYSHLDATSITIGYVIAKQSNLSQSFIENIEEQYNVKFLTISPSHPTVGDVVDFVIYQNYQPMIISKDVVTVKARRTTVMGYYG